MTATIQNTFQSSKTGEKKPTSSLFPPQPQCGVRESHRSGLPHPLKPKCLTAMKEENFSKWKIFISENEKSTDFSVICPNFWLVLFDRLAHYRLKKSQSLPLGPSDCSSDVPRRWNVHGRPTSCYCSVFPPRNLWALWDTEGNKQRGRIRLRCSHQVT